MLSMIDYEAKIGLFFACTEVLEPLLAYQLVKTFVYAIVFARVVTLQFLIPSSTEATWGSITARIFYVKILEVTDDKRQSVLP